MITLHPRIVLLDSISRWLQINIQEWFMQYSVYSVICNTLALPNNISTGACASNVYSWLTEGCNIIWCCNKNGYTLDWEANTCILYPYILVTMWIPLIQRSSKEGCISGMFRAIPDTGQDMGHHGTQKKVAVNGFRPTMEVQMIILII